MFTQKHKIVCYTQTNVPPVTMGQWLLIAQPSLCNNNYGAELIGHDCSKFYFIGINVHDVHVFEFFQPHCQFSHYKKKKEK
jgi:hypothetical protein